jgi:1,4-dihydroxy-2-naphthoate octaprenyltransferase
MNTWLLYWRMTRPGFLSITVVACLMGLASAAACGCGFDALKALATVVLAGMAHAGANVWNDYHDARNGADEANQQGMFPFTGGSRLIQQGQVSAEDTRRWALALLGVTALGGLLLALHSNGGLLWIGLLGVVLAWAYSAPPPALMSRGLGELTVAACWWLVVVGADFVQRGQWFVIPAYVGAGFSLLVANILLINGVPDAPSDAVVGKRTLATRLTPGQLAGLYTVLVALAHGWLVVGVWRLIPPAPTLLALATLPLGLRAAWLLWQHARGQTNRLRPAITLTIATANLHGLALAVGLLLPRWWLF